VAIYHPDNSGMINLNASLVNTQYSLTQIQINHRWTDVFGQRIKLEEERSRDNEIFHVLEAVDVMLIGDQLFSQVVSDVGADPVSIRRQ
jgi:hypothetical protein